MSKLVFLFVAVFGLIHFSFGQHCPFDNTGILVVQVIDATTNLERTDIVPYLVTGASKKEEQLGIEEDHDFMQNNKLLLDDTDFYINPSSTIKDWKPTMGLDSIRYTFAEDHFIRTISMDLIHNFDSLLIRVKDGDGNDLGVQYHVKPEDIFDLHENIGEKWTTINELGETPNPLTPFTQLITITL